MTGAIGAKMIMNPGSQHFKKEI